ncbi:MAG: D-Ala-D-Ala carboxypeptidase family metallohydrolase [Canidatus Methanoxibalbensis ujae]|nr:D-Ala-D-Ala carboxypeptidase family metallohydrolase [Candidatus Methanoxibalbensis ujae]
MPKKIEYPPVNWEEINFFRPKEFKCPCCGKLIIDPELVQLLDRIRYELGRPIRITSGYRCPSWNKKVGGKRNSAHLKGKAVDIYYPNREYLYHLIGILIFFRIPRIGIARNFVHIDIDLTKPHPRIWLY